MADVAVASVMIVSTRWIDTAARIAHDAPTIPVIWTGSAIIACAVYGGPWAGMAAAVPVWIGDLIERQTLLSESTFDGLVLLLVGGVGGYVVRLSLQAEAAVDRAARHEAAIAERERIARHPRLGAAGAGPGRQPRAGHRRRGGRARRARRRAGGGAALAGIG
jgi:Family of unknown function (DUF5931)